MRQHLLPPERVRDHDLQLPRARQYRQAIDRERAGQHLFAGNRPAIHEDIHGGRHDGLALGGEQRRRHEHRLRAEVGAELDAAETHCAAPWAGRGNRIADAQGCHQLGKVTVPGGVEARDAARSVLIARDHRVGHDALVAEQSQFEKAAALLAAAGLLGRHVVVEECARTRASGPRGIGGHGRALRRQERFRRQRDTCGHGRFVERDDGADLGPKAVIAFAVDLHGAARRRPETQPLEVLRADQQRAVDVATDDEADGLGLLVDVQFDDGFRERLGRGRFRSLCREGGGACCQQQDRGDARAQAHGFNPP